MFWAVGPENSGVGLEHPRASASQCVAHRVAGLTPVPVVTKEPWSVGQPPYKGHICRVERSSPQGRENRVRRRHELPQWNGAASEAAVRVSWRALSARRPGGLGGRQIPPGRPLCRPHFRSSVLPPSPKSKLGNPVRASFGLLRMIAFTGNSACRFSPLPQREPANIGPLSHRHGKACAQMPPRMDTVLGGRKAHRSGLALSRGRAAALASLLVLTGTATATAAPQRQRQPVHALGALAQLPGVKGCLVDRSRHTRGCKRVRALQGPGPLLGSCSSPPKAPGTGATESPS